MTQHAAALTPEALDGVLARARRSDFGRFQEQLRSSGFCARPVRLKGEVRTCGGQRVWSTDGEPDGVLRKACGNRREAICPSCAETYRADAFQLIAAGLRGGKGVPDTVSRHPALFLTLTAPSFGAVHTRRTGRDGKPLPCRPRRDAPMCPHGRPIACSDRHEEGDPCLGEPICVECFDHASAVAWNNLVGELWRRTTIYLPRTMARLTGQTQKALREQVRASYVKVAECQARGLVHLHVAIRLDRAMPAYRAGELRPPAPRYSLALLEQAIRETVAHVAAPVPEGLGGGHVRWGDQLDLRPLTGPGADAGECAGYLAKYATKSTEAAGGIPHRVDAGQVDLLPVRGHVREYLRAAFVMDNRAKDRRLGRCAHQFGFRGHCLTKSRRYSTTFTRLREARAGYVRARIVARAGGDQAQRRLAELDSTERISRFRFVGAGHLTTGDAYLAAKAAAQAREHRQLAREARQDELREQLQDIGHASREARRLEAREARQDELREQLQDIGHASREARRLEHGREGVLGG